MAERGRRRWGWNSQPCRPAAHDALLRGVRVRRRRDAWIVALRSSAHPRWNPRKCPVQGESWAGCRRSAAPDRGTGTVVVVDSSLLRQKALHIAGLDLVCDEQVNVGPLVFVWTSRNPTSLYFLSERAGGCSSTPPDAPTAQPDWVPFHDARVPAGVELASPRG